MGGIVHADGGAVLRQSPRGGPANTAGAAGHQRHLIAPRHWCLSDLVFTDDCRLKSRRKPDGIRPNTHGRVPEFCRARRQVGGMKRWLILAAGLGLVLAIAIIADQGFGAVAEAFAAVRLWPRRGDRASRRRARRRRARLVDRVSGGRAMSALRLRPGALHS